MRIFEHFSEQELVVLRARAERIAAPIQVDSAQDLITVLSVKVRSESYALPMDAIRAVYDNLRITPVPNVPPYALGITNIRGNVIFVLDLGLLLGIPGTYAVDDSQTIIVLDGDLGIAVQVNSVEGIENLAVSHLSADLPNLSLVSKAYLEGLTPEGKALLNVKSIVDDLKATSAAPDSLLAES